MVAAVLLILAGLTARMTLGARAELRLADAVAGRPMEAVHLRRAMAYYLPGNPYVAAAHRRLVALARGAEKDRRPAAALDTWRQLRSAILALRGLTRPYAETLPEANRRIAALSATGPRSGLSVKAHRELLNHPKEPRPLWALLAVVGFVAWVGGAVWLLWGGLRPDGGRRCGAVLAPLALTVAGFAVFAVGLAVA